MSSSDTARSMMVGQFSGAGMLTGACQFGHGVGGFAIKFIHSETHHLTTFECISILLFIHSIMN